MNILNLILLKSKLSISFGLQYSLQFFLYFIKIKFNLPLQLMVIAANMAFFSINMGKEAFKDAIPSITTF